MSNRIENNVHLHNLILNNNQFNIGIEENNINNYIANLLNVQINLFENIIIEAKFRSIELEILPPHIPIKGIYCCISLDEIKLNETFDICMYCSNVFKSELLDRWILESCSCPYCKQPIVKRIQSTLP